MKAEFNSLEDLEDNTEQLKGLLEKEKEEKDILQKELDKKIEAIDRLMNNPDYICKDKIKKKKDKLKEEKYNVNSPHCGFWYEIKIETLVELLESEE